MAKLFVAKVINGNASIVSEWEDNPKGAKVSFHNQCAALWNAEDVITGEVRILDENLSTFEGKAEFISHDQQVDA